MPNLSLWDEYIQGMQISWAFAFSRQDMQAFSKLSQDCNPLHADEAFAQSKGFEAPLIFGLLLASQMSRLIGEELPDKNAILTGIQMDFMQPAYPDDQLTFRAELINKSDATHALEFKCKITRFDKILCRGLVTAVWRS